MSEHRLITAFDCCMAAGMGYGFHDRPIFLVVTVAIFVAGLLVGVPEMIERAIFGQGQ